LGPAGVQVRWSRALSFDPGAVVHAPADGAIRVWLDLRQPGQAFIYLADGTTARFAAREVPAPALDVATEETIAQIVRATVGALLDLHAPALTRAEMAVAVERRAAPRRLGLELRLGYGAHLPAAGLVSHGPGAAMSVSYGRGGL